MMLRLNWTTVLKFHKLYSKIMNEQVCKQTFLILLNKTENRNLRDVLNSSTNSSSELRSLKYMIYSVKMVKKCHTDL